MFLVMILMCCSLSEGSKKEIYTSKSDFFTISKTSAFVDKSLLLKLIFEKPEMKLITTPKKFGKSTNMQMIKQFLSIQSREHEQTRKSFAKLKIYENDRQFFENNFGKWPVLFVDLKTKATVKDSEDAVEQFKISIHDSYLEYDYLKESNLLDEESRQVCRMWCGSISFRNMTQSDTEIGLGNLAKYLSKHFNKPVILLVDEYDSIINDALFHVKDNLIFEHIVKLTSVILGNVLKSNVETAVVTGVSYISSCGLSDINNLKTYRFLDDHDFVDFYGFLQTEVDNLFKDLNEKDKQEAYNLYTGYVCKNNYRTIYNPYSILQFLGTGEAKPYWDVSGYYFLILEMLKYPELELNFHLLLKGQGIFITYYDKICIRDVIVLKELYLQKTISQPNSNLLFSHLLELGFLTFHTQQVDHEKDNYDKVLLKVPNKEVYDIISSEVKNYYTEKCHVQPLTNKFSKVLQLLRSMRKRSLGLVS